MNVQTAPLAREPVRRIVGFDVARAFAILGMVIVNFTIVFAPSSEGAVSPLSLFVLSLQGRAAALFVVLAGIGASIGTARVRRSEDGEMRTDARVKMLKRALFLFVIGYAWLALWTADILHFYGVYLTIGAALLFVRDRWLIAAVVATIIAGLIFFLTADYFANWDTETLIYENLWTPTGSFRNLFFDGFHPVFPWVAFYIYGMWLGRRRLTTRRGIWVAFALSAITAISAELTAVFTVGKFPTATELETAGLSILTGVFPTPPTPFYMIAGAATATAIISLCIALGKTAIGASSFVPIVKTGQMALTVYILHVIFIFAVVAYMEIAGIGAFSLGAAMIISIIFVIGIIVFSTLWRRRFSRGPAESLMRSFSDAKWLTYLQRST